MTTPSPTQLTQELSTIYETLEQDGAEDLALGLAGANVLFRTGQAQQGDNMPVLLINVGRGIQMAVGITQMPEEIQKKTTAKAYDNKSFIMAIGDETEDTIDEWWITPMHPPTIFDPKTAVLGQYGKLTSMTQAPDSSDDKPLEPSTTADPEQFVPVLPLIGRKWCELVHKAMYPADMSDLATYQQLGYILKDYVESIEDPEVQHKVQNSLMGLITKSTAKRTCKNASTVGVLFQNTNFNVNSQFCLLEDKIAGRLKALFAKTSFFAICNRFVREKANMNSVKPNVNQPRRLNYAVRE